MRLPSKIILFIIAGILIAGGAFGGVTWYLTRDNEAEGEAQAADSPAVMYDAGDYITNLADPTSRRFISVHIKLEVSCQETVDEIDERTAVVRDRILGVLRSYTYAEVSGNEGMAMVGQEIVSKLNRLLQSGAVLNIYFSQFIVQ